MGAPAWKRIYHRARNAAEGRNSTFERKGLKQLSVYGDLRGKVRTSQADVWLNLTTLARLVREATASKARSRQMPQSHTIKGWHSAVQAQPISVVRVLESLTCACRAIASIFKPVSNCHSEERSDEESRSSFQWTTRFFAPCGRAE